MRGEANGRCRSIGQSTTDCNERRNPEMQEHYPTEQGIKRSRTVQLRSCPSCARAGFKFASHLRFRTWFLLATSPLGILTCKVLVQEVAASREEASTKDLSPPFQWQQ